jgi:2-polyprenyl-3-methyl-5-hydroxy-6-metoxy-1,4-benzoquinol methylase
MNYTKTEKEKYQQIWDSIDYTSGNAIEFANTVHRIIQEDHCYANIVDLGCGSGITMKKLMGLGYINVYGIDITLNGIKDVPTDRLLEAPLWNMVEGILNETEWPAPTYTISTDVLEHIPPEMVEQTIKEIIAITCYKTIHCIFTRPDKTYCGYEVHLTVKPIDWWQRQFDRLNTKGIEVVLFGRD